MGITTESISESCCEDKMKFAFKALSTGLRRYIYVYIYRLKNVSLLLNSNMHLEVVRIPEKTKAKSTTFAVHWISFTPHALSRKL